MKPFHVAVRNVREAKLLLTTLAKYDIFQFENHIKPDYCNAGGLEVFEDGEWCEWYDEGDHGIAPQLQLTEADIEELARRDQANKPAFFGFAEACAILGYPVPRPDLAEARQTAGVRCKDLR